MSIFRLPFTGLALLVLTVVPALAVSYTGSLSTEAPSGLDGTGFWAEDSDPYSTITWTVTQQPMGHWYYEYAFVVQTADASHFILEVSDGFSLDNEMDLWGLTGSGIDPGKLFVTTHEPGGGNPSMPDSIYGIKFDETAGTNLEINFYSWRSPVWGDFYAKCGAVGGTQNTLWNLGFTADDVDPLDAPANGSVGNHILVPNSYSDPIPEPGTIALMGLGLAGLALWTRRRRAAA